MSIWHNVSQERIKPEDFLVVIEIPKGSKKKYELDKEIGLLILDRILSTSMQYPLNYGFVPRTLSEDHDPLDVLVLCSETIDPFCVVRCYPIGLIELNDNGELDEKIVAVPFDDPYYNTYKDIKELPPHLVKEIEHFFSVYKQLENKKTYVKPAEPRAMAVAVIKKSIESYNKTFASKN